MTEGRAAAAAPRPPRMEPPSRERRPARSADAYRLHGGMVPSAPEAAVTDKDRLRAEYVARINRALDYIQAHLTEPLGLEQIARVVVPENSDQGEIVEVRLGPDQAALPC